MIKRQHDGDELPGGTVEQIEDAQQPAAAMTGNRHQKGETPAERRSRWRIMPPAMHEPEREDREERQHLEQPDPQCIVPAQIARSRSFTISSARMRAKQCRTGKRRRRWGCQKLLHNIFEEQRRHRQGGRQDQEPTQAAFAGAAAFLL